jgi:hypothetical protein
VPGRTGEFSPGSLVPPPSPRPPGLCASQSGRDRVVRFAELAITTLHPTMWVVMWVSCVSSENAEPYQG